VILWLFVDMGVLVVGTMALVITTHYCIIMRMTVP
jgi:hypothetical protein